MSTLLLIQVISFKLTAKTLVSWNRSTCRAHKRGAWAAGKLIWGDKTKGGKTHLGDKTIYETLENLLCYCVELPVSLAEFGLGDL
jgi:hypothetical protein